MVDLTSPSSGPNSPKNATSQAVARSAGRSFGKTSIRRRLMFLVSGAVLMSALPVAALFGVEEANRAARARWSEMKTAADVLASASVEAVQANDSARAFQILRAISKSPGVTYARIKVAGRGVLSENGAAVRIKRDVRISADEPNPNTLDLIRTKTIEVTAPIMVGTQQIGEVVVLHEADDIAGQITRSVLSVLSLAALATLLAMLVAQRVQAAMTRPLVNLTKSVATISSDNDFSRRVDVESGDEVGDLVAGFNAMLEAIQARDSRIEDHMRGLEAQVASRTQDYLAARNEAQAASAAKSEFVATMSHEIRTPMNGVMVMAELLSAENLPGKARRYAETIAKSGRSLLAVINDILDFSKIEAGKMDVEICPVDLVELIDDTLQLFAAKAHEKGLELVASIHPMAPRIVPADPVRLGQILSNLISNALKFTQEGHVLVRLEPDPTGASWRLVVVDTGLGIAKDKLGSIFGAFSQEDQTTTRRFGGTGLGLSISKRLSEAMGGAIAVTSTQGKGSAFHVRLPTLPPGDPNAASAAPPDLSHHQPPMHAFLGLDGQLESVVLTRRLEAAGLCVLDDGSQAADLILVDMAHLERLSAASLKVEAKTCVLVAQAGDQAAEEMLRAGHVACVLERPVRHEQLDDLLVRLSQGLPLVDPEQKTNSSALNLVSFPKARVLVVDDSEVNREIACEALQRFDIAAATANDGQEALDRLAGEDFDLVLMDGSMPVLDGFEATRALRAREQSLGLKPTPVIALTAFVVGTAAEAWRSSGMDGVLHKPFSLADLGAILSKHLPEALAEARWTAPEDEARFAEAAPMVQVVEEAVSTAPPAGLFDEAVISSLIAGLSQGRGDFVRRVTGLYREHGPKAVDELRTCQSANDCDGIARAAHALKSMSLNIGAKGVAQQAAAIENAVRGENPEEVTSPQIEVLATCLEQTLAALAQRLDQPEMTTTATAPVSAPAEGQAALKPTPNPAANALPRLAEQPHFDERLANELAIDIAAGALEMVYQPLFDRTGTRIVSAEALVRWSRGARSPVGPAVFVPLAERSGLISELGQRAREIVMYRTAKWDLPIALNVSPLELIEADFVKRLDATLVKTGFPASRLVLEVTETAFIGEPDRILALFKEFKQRGIALSLDDFGAGYSSLTSLHRFPFDKIKIDREFVSALDGDARSALEALAIIQAVTGIGRVLGREVVAEGVETPAQHVALKSAGVHTMQGYLFSKPVSAEALEAMLSEPAPLARHG